MSLLTESLANAEFSGLTWDALQRQAHTMAWLMGAALVLGLVLRALRSLAAMTAANPTGQAHADLPLEATPKAMATSRPLERLADGQSGLAVTEFALIAPIGMIALLVFIQAALVLQAQLVVEYAAYCGARAAVVWIPRQGFSEDPLYANNMGVAAMTDRNDSANNTASDFSPSVKIQRIQGAAAYACWPISIPAQTSDMAGQMLARNPPLDAVVGLRQLMATLPVGQSSLALWSPPMMAAKYAYALTFTRVKIQPIVPPADMPFLPPRGTFPQTAYILVQVEHDFALQVPLAGRLLGQQINQGNIPLYVTTLTAGAMMSNEGFWEIPFGVWR